LSMLSFESSAYHYSCDFCWRICLISESMGHHDSEIMDDGRID
jgi:pterin-4a-carbinolamine dehydratase